MGFARTALGLVTPTNSRRGVYLANHLSDLSGCDHRSEPAPSAGPICGAFHRLQLSLGYTGDQLFRELYYRVVSDMDDEARYRGCTLAHLHRGRFLRYLFHVVNLCF